jgi:hypothetical protein
MANLTITAAQVRPVQIIRPPRSEPAGGTITAGDVVYMDTAGKVQRASAGADATENPIGYALRSVVSGETVSILGPDSLIDLGDALGGLAYAAPVYLSDTAGASSSTAGSASVVMGRVESVFSQVSGTADKLLRISGALPG